MARYPIAMPAGLVILKSMPVPALRKISETIIEFGKPLINQLDADQPDEVVRSTFEIVIMVWNAHVMAMPRWGQPGFIVDLQKRLRDPQMPAPMVDAIRELSRRRAERFANDTRAVGEWSVVMQSGHWRLRCDARTPSPSDR